MFYSLNTLRVTAFDVLYPVHSCFHKSFGIVIRFNKLERYIAYCLFEHLKEQIKSYLFTPQAFGTILDTCSGFIFIYVVLIKIQ